VLFLKEVLLEPFFHQTINSWWINAITVKYLDLSFTKIYRVKHMMMKGKVETIVSMLIKKCNEEFDLDKRIQILQQINSVLPQTLQLKIPSLITDDYIDIALYRIEEKIQSGGNDIPRLVP
jgi:hypothetical protein